MSLKQNKIFVFFLVLILVGEISLFFLNKAKAEIISVDDPTGDDVDNGLCSIVEAILNHNSVDQSGSVDCEAGSGEGDVISIETDITLDTVYSVDGNSIPYGLPGGNNYTINGNGYSIERDETSSEFRIFLFSGFGDVEINDLTIRGGDVDSFPAGKGAAIYASALHSLTLNNVNFYNNTATDGGAMYVSMDSSPNLNLVIDDSTFSENISANSGGAIYLNNPSNTLDLTLSGSIFSENSSVIGNGNSIYSLNSSNFEITQSIFDEDDSTSSGHMLYINGSDISIRETKFLGNDNPGIQFVNSQVLIEGSSFSGFRSSTNGGALLVTDSDLDIVNSTFYDNLSFGGAGGAIYVDSPSSTLNISYSTFSGNNTGGGNGGDISIGGAPNSAFIENSIFIATGYNDICSGDFTNFTFTNNLYSHDDSDCGILATSVSGVGLFSDNGGYVFTVPVSSISNALNLGSTGTLGCPDTDARGVPRPLGGGCDIGAYEYAGDFSISISESSDSTNISEPNTTDTYTISLGEAPSSTVTIDFDKSDNDFSVSPSSVNFTTLNWFIPKIITVNPIDNSIDDGDRTRTITHTVDTSDLNYSEVVPNNVTVNITDDDESTSGGGSSTRRVYGCMDQDATNYNSRANISDGSCLYAPTFFLGCDDLEAINYDIRVTENDGSCRYKVPLVPTIVSGCMDSTALNYNPSANTSDASCTYAPVVVYGCTDMLALNYNPSANNPDTSCVYEVVSPEPPIIEEPINLVTGTPTLESLPEEVKPLPVKQAPPIYSTVKKRSVGEVLNATTQNISDVVGDVLGIISEKSLQSIAFAGIVLPFFIFIILYPTVILSSLLFLKRKNKESWGVVYNSVTKEPLSGVELILEDESGKKIGTSVSDSEGNFGFITLVGKFKIKAIKHEFEFPSNKLLGKTVDTLYENLYFDEYLEIKDQYDVVTKNIPMDPLKFNWNEFEAPKNKNLMRFYLKFDLFLSDISKFIFAVCLCVSLVLVFASPSVFNFLILGIYYIIIFFKSVGIGPKKPGYVLYFENKTPLSFGIIKIFSGSSTKEVAHQIIGKTGRYYAHIPNGEYSVQISKKIGEDEYEHIFTSEKFKIKNGHLDHIFRV